MKPARDRGGDIGEPARDVGDIRHPLSLGVTRPDSGTMDPERPSGSGGVAATRDRTWRQPLLLTPEEAAEILRISRAHLYELILSGLIRSIKIGRCRRIPPSALEEFVAAMLAEQCPDVMRT